MPDNGKIMSQTYYERQSKLLYLYQESFIRKDMDAKETVMALKMIGFSDGMAAIRVNEWATLTNTFEPETEKAKKNRLKQRTSLEKYILQTSLGTKYYLRFKYIRSELSKEETVKKLIQKGYSQEIARSLVNDWEAEK